MAKKKNTRTVRRQDSRAAKTATRHDGWMSMLSAVGTQRDPRQYATFKAITTNWRENIDLWRQDDLAGRIVEEPPNDMLREGWELCIEGDDDNELSKRVTTLLEDLCLDDRLWQGLCLERAVGGSGIVMGTQDLADMEDPLELDDVRGLKWLETFEPLELQASKWQVDPELPGFGRPETYTFFPQSPGGAKKTGFRIHASRIIVFPGIVVSRRQITSQAGWGDAILTRCRETLRDFQTSWAAAGVLMHSFATPVWKIKNLAEIIALDRDAEVKARIEIMQLAMATLRAVVIDAEGEEFERKQTPITGLPEMMQQFATRLAAAAQMPVTKLMGVSPGGMNATGESDTRGWYDVIGSMQERKLKRPIETAVKVAFRALGIDEPKNWYIKFHPLWQPTEQEQATTRFTQSQTDEKYINLGVYSADEVRAQGFGGREWTGARRVSGPPPEPPPLPSPAGQEYQQQILPGAAQQKTLPSGPPAAPASKVERADDGEDDELWPDTEDGLTEEEAEDAYLAWLQQHRQDDWSEDDHPRDEHGKFGEGGGGGGEKNVPVSEKHGALMKEARDHAKAAVGHAKGIRELAKKDPTNQVLQDKLKAAESAAKAARSAARKAEKSKSEAEAAKHVESAKKKADEAAGHAASTESASKELTYKELAEKAKAQSEATKYYTGQAAADMHAHAATAHDKAASAAMAVGNFAAEKLHTQKMTEHEAAIAEVNKAPTVKVETEKKPESIHPKYSTTPADPNTEAAKAALELSKAAAKATDKIPDPKSIEKALLLAKHQTAADAHAAAAKAAHEAGFHGTGTAHEEKAKFHEATAKGENGPKEAKLEVLAAGEKFNPEHEVDLADFSMERIGYTSSLTKGEKDAALKYSGSAYVSINAALRAGKGHPVTKELDKALDKATVQKDIVVHRGISGDFANQLGSLGVGDTFHDKAYVSTSAGKSSAFGGQAEVHITVPKGMKAGPIPSHSPGEREYLIPRNTRFEVTHIEKATSGGMFPQAKLHIHVRVVSHGGPA